MSTPFIRNHQYNVIKRQTEFLLRTLRTVADRKVLETVRYRAALTITEAFPSLTEDQRRMLERISTFETAYEFQNYLTDLEAYVEPYPPITEKQIQKLFPKSKKLKVPDLQAIDFRFVTYLGWVDVATNRLFIVYPHEGKFIGIEGRITPTNKKGYCMFCNLSTRSWPSSPSRPKALCRITTLPSANTSVSITMHAISPLPIQDHWRSSFSPFSNKSPKAALKGSLFKWTTALDDLVHSDRNQ